MATLRGTKALEGMQPRSRLGVECVYSEYALTAALADEDIIKLFKVPKGAIIVDLHVFIPDLDTDGSPAIELEIGDTDDADRFLATGSNLGQAAGWFSLIEVAVGAGTLNNAFYEYTADADIQIRVETAPATGATSGTIKAVLFYTLATA